MGGRGRRIDGGEREERGVGEGSGRGKRSRKRRRERKGKEITAKREPQPEA